MAARPPRGLCSPVSSTDGLGPTLGGLEPCIGHHHYSFIEQTFLTFFLSRWGHFRTGLVERGARRRVRSVSARDLMGLGP